MYKNCALILCLSMLITGMCAVNANELNMNQELSGGVLDMTLEEMQAELKEEDIQEVYRFREMMQSISSPERTVDYSVLVNENAIYLDEESIEILCRIVEAEAGTEDEKGRILVANVVMNRVRSAQFPDTISEVVYERSEGRAQFSPTADGRIDKVTISSDTIEAVARVMSGEDVSAGALYFRAISSKEGWFDQSLNRVLEHGNHIFYTM